jgi:hypothetical protein
LLGVHDLQNLLPTTAPYKIICRQFGIHYRSHWPTLRYRVHEFFCSLSFIFPLYPFQMP